MSLKRNTEPPRRRRAPFNPEELGATRTLESSLDARVEAAGGSPFLIEGHQRLDVTFDDRPAECAARKPGKNPLRARLLVAIVFRTADEDVPAARRVVVETARRGRPADRHQFHTRIVVIELVERSPGRPNRRLYHAFGLSESAHERDADVVRTGRDGNADFEPRVGRVHVLFECRIALGVANPALRHRPASGFSTDREPLDQRAIDPAVDLMRLPHPQDVAVQLPFQPDFDLVVAAEWKVITDRGAALRSERQVVAHAPVLHEQPRDVEILYHRLDAHADREPADLARGADVAVEEGRRHRQHARHVLEAFLIRLVGPEHRRRVDLEREQIADGVHIFAAVQSMDRDAARVRMARGGLVERFLERRDHRLVGRPVGTRRTGRRHLAGAQLADDFLPGFGRLVHTVGINPFERQPGGLQPFVVAHHTVLIDVGSRFRGCGRRLNSRCAGHRRKRAPVAAPDGEGDEAA